MTSGSGGNVILEASSLSARDMWRGRGNLDAMGRPLKLQAALESTRAVSIVGRIMGGSCRQRACLRK